LTQTGARFSAPIATLSVPYGGSKGEASTRCACSSETYFTIRKLMIALS